ncbi:MAG: hypothetical protein KAF40_11100, partial [Flavihumibacter sp.]|nr:hypothetical protein [Flavihumibacter sp.]
MRKMDTRLFRRWQLLIAVIFVCIQPYTNAQTKLNEYLLFSGAPNCTSCGIEIGSANQLKSGRIGGYGMVRSTGSATINSSIHTNTSIQLTNSNTVIGNLTAANTSNNSQAISLGSNSQVTGNLDAAGNIFVGGGTIRGTITHPVGTNYTGPQPINGVVRQQTPDLPVLPVLPNQAAIQNVTGTSITNTRSISPGVYGAIELNGNKTITFNGPGIYTFKLIRNSGNFNKFIFDFGTNTTGIFKLLIEGDVDLGKLAVDLKGSGSAARIYAEAQGNGSSSKDKQTAWIQSNGSTGSTVSQWFGTIYVPNGNVVIGSGSSISKITGAIWSGRKIIIGSSVELNHVALEFCSEPPVADAGSNTTLSCAGSPTATLTARTQTPNALFTWKNAGGTILGTSSSITVSATGVYLLTVTDPVTGCSSTDDVLVEDNSDVCPLYQPPVTGKVDDLIGSELDFLSKNPGGGANTQDLFLIQNEGVFVEIIVYAGKRAYVLDLLTQAGSAYGLDNLISNGSNEFIITGRIPISNLQKLNSFNEDNRRSPDEKLINFCRPVYPPVTDFGQTSSQGDSSIATNQVRAAYQLAGAGVKIGVLSDSYNTTGATPLNPPDGGPARTDVQNGDFPGPENTNFQTPVEIVKEFPYGRRSDEGRAMLQIIHDLAPAASLAFRTGFISPGDFAQGILELQSISQCDIMVDDITFITEPFFKDGKVAQAVDQVAAAGVSYFSASGNYGNKSYQR